jgi:ubiquinone/menaquinone biosynthesis C-methylase UbiE
MATPKTERTTMRTYQENTHVCPWWLAYTFDNPVRRWLHNPEKILAGLVDEGHKVLDIGCGMGHFSIGMAKMVGPDGCVIAADLQKKMLARVRGRAEHNGLLERIRLHQCRPDRIGLTESVDFVLAFWMVHEVPNRPAFLAEVRSLLKPKAHFLVVEPRLHVSASDVQRTIELACAAGLKLHSEPEVRLSRAVLFVPD